MNIRIVSLLCIFALVAVFGVLQQLAFENYLYWKFWWYDVLMHFLGGIVVGSVFLWIARFEFPEKARSVSLRYVSVFLFVLVIGILWEMYEYFVGIDREFSRTMYMTDTAQDLVLDMLGASLAYTVYRYFPKKNG